MVAANQHSLRRYAGYVPNAIVLGMLSGIAIWGHAAHWKIPKFSKIVGQKANPAANGAHDVASGVVRPDLGENQAGSSGSSGFLATELPVIRYAGEGAVEKAGIAIDSVQERQMDEFVTAYGTVGYDEAHLAQLSCRVSGIVWRVLKKLGDPVKKGEILAIIDAAEVGRAKAELLNADVDLDLKTQHLKRLKVVTSSISERQLREVEAELRKASVRSFNARQTLINLGLPISVQRIAEVSDDELARQIHFLGLPPEIVSTLDIDHESANLIPLVSPLDGIVIRREVVTGEVVEPSKAQFVVADVRHMWLLLNVRKSDAVNLAVGQEIYFSLAGLTDEINSKLAWIATEVDPKTRNVQVRAEIENRLVRVEEDGSEGSWQLRSGMFGTGRIRVRHRPATLAVPSTAVQWDGTSHLIFIPHEDGVTFQPQRVEIGVTRDGYTEIRSGVNSGQPVVSSGAFALKSELVGVDR